MVDVRLLQEQRNEEMNQTVGIINPSSFDFTCTHDSNADKKPISYTIKSREGLMLKRYIADHISLKLCSQMLSNSKEMITQEMFDKVLKTIRLYED